MSWADYLSQQEQFVRQGNWLAESLPEDSTLRISLSETEHQAAMTAGLGVLGEPLADQTQATALQALEFKLATLAAGVTGLNADFTPLLGDVVWQLEMQQTVLLDVLGEIRLAEFERAARAYRTRGER